MPKQSRHVDVDHGEAGASPVDHPRGALTVELTEAACKAVVKRPTGCESQRSHERLCGESASSQPGLIRQATSVLQRSRELTHPYS